MDGHMHTCTHTHIPGGQSSKQPSREEMSSQGLLGRFPSRKPYFQGLPLFLLPKSCMHPCSHTLHMATRLQARTHVPLCATYTFTGLVALSFISLTSCLLPESPHSAQLSTQWKGFLHSSLPEDAPCLNLPVTQLW